MIVMDENYGVEVIVTMQGQRTIGGVEYDLYCQRKSKADADKIKADLIECGCKASVSKNDSVYTVWWAR